MSMIANGFLLCIGFLLAIVALWILFLIVFGSIGFISKHRTDIRSHLIILRNLAILLAIAIVFALAYDPKSNPPKSSGVNPGSWYRIPVPQSPAAKAVASDDPWAEFKPAPPVKRVPNPFDEFDPDAWLAANPARPAIIKTDKLQQDGIDKMKRAAETMRQTGTPEQKRKYALPPPSPVPNP